MPHEYLHRYELFMRSKNRSPTTIEQRLRGARRVLDRWPDPDLATPGQVSEWLGAVPVKFKAHTRATYHSDARAFFRWLALKDVGLISRDPMDSDLIERPSTGRGIPKPLTPVEESRALAAAHGHMRAYLLLALRAGLRASEIAALRGENVNEDHIILYGKGDKEDHVPTHPEIWALAQEYPRRGWWFPSPRHHGHVAGSSISLMVGKHFRRPDVDIPSGSIHRCRHSYATSLLRRGVNLRKVQTLMRHASSATTDIYTAVDEDELRAAINLLGTVA